MTEAEEKFVQIVRNAISEMIGRIKSELTFAIADSHDSALEKLEGEMPLPENVVELEIKKFEEGLPLPAKDSFELIIGELLHYALAMAMTLNDLNSKEAYKLIAEQLVYAREEIDKELEARGD